MDPVQDQVILEPEPQSLSKKWAALRRDTRVFLVIFMSIGIVTGIVALGRGISLPKAASVRKPPIIIRPRPTTLTQACPGAVYKYEGTYNNSPLANKPEVTLSGDVYVPFGQKVLKYTAGPTPTVTWAGKCKGGANCIDYTPDIQKGHSNKFDCINGNAASCITPVPADPHEYDWQFKEARGASLDGNGYAYVADYYSHRISKLGLNDGTYNYIGKCLGNVGGSTACNVGGQFANGFSCNVNTCTRDFASESGLGDQQFYNPAGIKVVGSNLYVTDNRNSNNKVKVFNTSGGFVSSWNVDYASIRPTPAVTLSESVGGVDVDSDRVYVAANSHYDPGSTTLADYWSGVMVFDTNGNYIQNQSVVSTRNSSVINTVDVDESGTMYVAYNTLLGGVGGWGLEHYRYEPQLPLPPAPTPIVYTPKILKLKKYTTGTDYQYLMLCNDNAIASVDAGGTLFISSSYDPYDPSPTGCIPSIPSTCAYCDSGGYPVVPSTGVMKFVCDTTTPTPTSVVSPTPTPPNYCPVNGASCVWCPYCAPTNKICMKAPCTTQATCVANVCTPN